MSSQGLNATTFSGYISTSNGNPGVTGSPSRLPLRDAQDFTLLTKRIGVSNAFSNVAPSQAYPVIQSNQNRLSVRFAELLCTRGLGNTCDGPFPPGPTSGIRRG